MCNDKEQHQANTSLLLGGVLGRGGPSFLNCTGSFVKLERGGGGGECFKKNGSVKWAGLRPALPVDRQVQPVDGVEGLRRWRVQLQLGQQGEVVRGDVGVGAAGDVVVDEPLAVQRSHQAQDAHVGLGEEDVVDDALRRRGQRRYYHKVTRSQGHKVTRSAAETSVYCS